MHSQAASSDRARQAAEARASQLEQQLQVMQQRMGVLKEQLMSGQTAAEETEQQAVQDAVLRAETKFNEKLHAMQQAVRNSMPSLC